jgi:hypothetical protein
VACANATLTAVAWIRDQPSGESVAWAKVLGAAEGSWTEAIRLSAPGWSPRRLICAAGREQVVFAIESGDGHGFHRLELAALGTPSPAMEGETDDDPFPPFPDPDPDDPPYPGDDPPSLPPSGPNQPSGLYHAVLDAAPRPPQPTVDAIPGGVLVTWVAPGSRLAGIALREREGRWSAPCAIEIAVAGDTEALEDALRLVREALIRER